MSVGIRIGDVVHEIGTPEFLRAFFSTISVRLEPAGWGSRFPRLLGDLYRGRLDAARAMPALDELELAKTELSRFPPSSVVWDAEDASARPPWGDEISEHITSLGNYFVSSTGRDLFDLLAEALQASARSGDPAAIVEC